MGVTPSQRDKLLHYTEKSRKAVNQFFQSASRNLPDHLCLITTASAEPSPCVYATKTWLLFHFKICPWFHYRATIALRINSNLMGTKSEREMQSYKFNQILNFLSKEHFIFKYNLMCFQNKESKFWLSSSSKEPKGSLRNLKCCLG